MKKDKEKELFSKARVYEKNIQKIKSHSFLKSAYIVFPYNQKNLLVPDKHFWLDITKKMSLEDLIICSPNALIDSKPQVVENQCLITANEFTFRYWEEVKTYLVIAQITNLIIISSDIHLSRILRDFSFVFKSTRKDLQFKSTRKDLHVEIKTIKITNSFWKMVYKTREIIVSLLPLNFYKYLGEKRA